MFPTLKEVSLVREVAYKQIVTKCHMSYDFYKNKQGAMLKKKKTIKSGSMLLRVFWKMFELGSSFQKQRAFTAVT